MGSKRTTDNYHSRLRVERLDSGLCGVCGGSPAIINLTICERCNQLKLARDRKNRQTLIAKGLCPICRANEVKAPFVNCGDCREKRRAYEKILFDRGNKRGERREADRLKHLRNREERNAKAVARNLEYKRKAVLAYGGGCSCCGEDGLQFLGIDHVHGDGAEHRRELKITGGGINFYLWAAKNNYPDKDRLSVLCHNCNQAKGVGVACPHKLGTVEKVDKYIVPTNQLSLFDWRPANV